MLGVDRDSEIVAFDFDERDPGVKAMIRQAVEGARRNERHVRHLRPGAVGLSGDGGIPGRARHRFDQRHARYLLKTTLHVLEVEKRLGLKPRKET